MNTTQSSTSTAQFTAYPPLQSRLAAEAMEGPVSLIFLPQQARFSLRVAEANRAQASKVFGVGLPVKIGEVATEKVGAAERSALCLGPDEWVLYADVSQIDTVAAAFNELYAATPHSLVDISEREIALSLSGDQASTLLSVGSPIDLRALAIGEARRTVFDGASVVLHRDSETNFRLEVWRSFLPHVWDLLNTANRELATGY